MGYEFAASFKGVVTYHDSCCGLREMGVKAQPREVFRLLRLDRSLDICATVDEATKKLGAVVFEPANPANGHFWAEAIGWPVVYDQDGDVAIRAPDGRGPFITFGPPGTAKSGKNRLHLDLAPHLPPGPPR